jgi:hypothetical protein
MIRPRIPRLDVYGIPIPGGGFAHAPLDLGREILKEPV